ncbi:MAG: hypothetical protein DMG32_06020 [Acidobacteria bacterium]|nr:MAG: hypothetical protein DMG32_06020 [Acidobacteriota bacterium]
MKLHLANSLVIMTCVLALVCMVSVSAGAQQDKGQPSAPGYAGAGKAASKALSDGGPPPRLTDGHPDLSGIWFVGGLGKEDARLAQSAATQGDPAQRPFDPKVTPEEKPSFQPWAAEKVKQMGRGPAAGALSKMTKEQQLAAIDTEIARLERECMPHGVPGITLVGAMHGMQMVTAPGTLVQLTELNHDWRVVSIDGRAHSKEPDPKFNGESVARWDGDTLVIDTIGLDDRTWNDGGAWIHSDQQHVVERFSRPSRNYLIYQVTVEDPKVLTKPWVSAPHKFSLSVSSDPLNEWYCGINPDGDEEVRALKETRKRLAEEISKESSH